jgi:hypothetical protein
LVTWAIGVLCAHSHLLFEVYLSLVVGLLSVFDLAVSFVDQMVAGCNMVMTVIFNTFLSILPIKIVLDESLLKKFILDRHLFFAREQAHVPVAVLHLEGPCVVSDLAHRESCLWICVQDPSNHVLALPGEELGQGVLCTHDLLVEV